MPPREDYADWQADPEDKPALVSFFNSIRSRIGEGGSWAKQELNEAAAHMAQRGEPLKGGPKTAASIRSQWPSVRVQSQ